MPFIKASKKFFAKEFSQLIDFKSHALLQGANHTKQLKKSKDENKPGIKTVPNPSFGKVFTDCCSR